MATNIPVLEELREEKITTVVADDLEIKGTVKFKTSVMLKGIFEGEIISEGLLVVGPTAKVTATITTKTLISHGEITGNVTAGEQCVLKSTATHTGNLVTPFLTIENGAVFNGVAIMERKVEIEEVAQEEDPPAVEPEAAEPHVVQPQVTEPQVVEPQVTEQTIVQPQEAEQPVVQPQEAEPQTLVPPTETEREMEGATTSSGELSEESPSAKANAYREGSFTSNRHKKTR